MGLRLFRRFPRPPNYQERTMVTDTFKAEVGAELDRVFGAEHVVRDAVVDPRTGEITGGVRGAGRERQSTLPTFEGMAVDNWQVSFGGTIEVDRFSEGGRELIERCRFGESVTLVVTGVVVGVSGKYKPETDKAEAEVTRGVRVAVDRVALQ